MTLVALLLPLVVTAPAATDPDAELRSSLELVYRGHVDDALTRLRAAADARPEDPMAAYVLALALCWKVEQQPETELLDREVKVRAANAVARADAALERDPADVRALFARGAAWGALSRYHLFRLHRSDAARAAVRMRQDLTSVRVLDPGHEDARFGLGLYDYYADVLPRAAKVIRFLARVPGGDRRRGLATIEDAASGSTLHRTEARVQLFEIYAFYEEQPGRAMDQLDELRRLYPTHPLWALRAAEHLRARLGAYGDAVAAGREILARAARGETNYRGPWVPALTRLEMGHALLSDLRPAEARPVLLAVARDGIPGYAAAAARARYLLGRSLETEGDREGALAHYRIAAGGADTEWRKRASAAVSTPIAPARVRALLALGEARRRRAARPDPGRRERDAENQVHSSGANDALPLAREALRLWPQSMEAALAVVEDRLAAGDVAGARDAWPRSDAGQQAETPWLRPWEWLLEAERLDLEGRREDAVRQYKKVLQGGFCRPDLEQRAEAGIEGPFRP
jgi:tetratricopeptide (TPR) repeat protein